MKKKIVKFYTPTCQPCKLLEPHLNAAARRGVEIERVDVSQENTKACEFRITSVPTLDFYHDDKLYTRMTGVSRAVIQTIDEF
jgi:thioredoxin-like negative regulator of GroEL